jgi:hypothetical protein
VGRARRRDEDAPTCPNMGVDTRPRPTTTTTTTTTTE